MTLVRRALLTSGGIAVGTGLVLSVAVWTDATLTFGWKTAICMMAIGTAIDVGLRLVLLIRSTERKDGANE